MEARQQWEITLSKLNLSTKEREGQENIRSPSGFLNYVKQLENKHEAKRKTRSRDKVLENLLSLENFANTYSPVVDAVVAADPSGAVNVIWSVCSVGATVSPDNPSQNLCLDVQTGLTVCLAVLIGPLDYFQQAAHG